MILSGNIEIRKTSIYDFHDTWYWKKKTLSSFVKRLIFQLNISKNKLNKSFPVWAKN